MDMKYVLDGMLRSVKNVDLLTFLTHLKETLKSPDDDVVNNSLAFLASPDDNEFAEQIARLCNTPGGKQHVSDVRKRLLQRSIDAGLSANPLKHAP